MADPGLNNGGELEFEPLPRTAFGKRRGLWLTVAVLVLVAGAGGGWYAMDAWAPGDGEPSIPLIRAAAGPVKVRPESPGGMKVPDRDKLVYGRMQGNEEMPLVERLLPGPEQPLPPPKAPPAAKMQPAPDAAPAPEGGAVPVQAAAPASAPPEAEPEPPPAAPSRVPTPAEVLAAKPPQAPPPPAEIKKPDANKADYKVQLAAIRSPQLAQQEWKRLRAKNADLLGRLELSVSRADLGPSKGVFFRLRAGPLPDETAARALCAKLAQRKVGCLVVPPEG